MCRQYCILLALAIASANAQYLGHPSPGIPRTRDGKPNLSAPTPRASNGKPDLSGIWQVDPTPFEELARLLPGGLNGLGEGPPSKYFINILADFPLDAAPLQPAAGAAFRKNMENFSKDGPNSRCLPAGVPNYELIPSPYKIVQTPSLVVMLFEADTTFRQIFTDGRRLPVDPQPAWIGYSVGKMGRRHSGVETAGFNDRGWLDVMGHTHSEALRVTERFQRRDFGHMEVQITVDDPKTLTKPVTIKVTQTLHADTDLLEYFCAENEKDAHHMVGK
jgi:hypothetical protein